MYNELYEDKPAKKAGAGGYVITAVISVVLSVSLCMALVPAIQRGKLPFSKTIENNIFEQYTRTEGETLSVVDIAKKNGPCIVGVNVKLTSTGWFGQAYESEGSGSGIVMSSDGYIATNNHVVDGASSVRVTFYNGDEYEAKVIGTDAKTDLAVIKIEAYDLQYVEFGKSGELLVGDLAVAIGNPLGQEFAGSVTVGFISALNRTVQVDGRIYKLIQTDAAINSGNSGGALINQQGQVIGINSVKVSTAEGMGFAIPIDIAAPILDDLIAFGYVKGRPLIGFVARQEITKDMAARYEGPEGIYVGEVTPFGGAEKAGMKVQDIIVKVGGEECLTMIKCNEIKDKYKAGDTLEIEVKRKNEDNDKWESVKLSVVLTEEKP